MELSEYVAMLRGELTSITRVAGEDVAQAADLIGQALEPSVRLTLLDVLTAAAAEITSRLDDTVVEVRLAGGEASFVVQGTGPSQADEQTPGGEADDVGVTRVTLRLPESLKASVESAAAADGVSVNTWLVRAARRGLGQTSGKASRRVLGQRITGTARS
jgi:hypothetical protein